MAQTHLQQGFLVFTPSPLDIDRLANVELVRSGVTNEIYASSRAIMGL